MINSLKEWFDVADKITRNWMLSSLIILLVLCLVFWTIMYIAVIIRNETTVIWFIEVIVSWLWLLWVASLIPILYKTNNILSSINKKNE